METDPASASCSPVWNATLGFGGLTADLLAGRALELTLWDACPGIDPVLIGECTVCIKFIKTFYFLSNKIQARSKLYNIAFQDTKYISAKYKLAERFSYVDFRY